MKLISGKLTLEISFPLAAAMTAVILYDSSTSVLECLIAVILHESGHLLMLHRYGSFPKRIKLTLFDIAITDTHKTTRGFSQELAVTLAGIISNIIFTCLSFLLYFLFPCSFFEGLTAANLSLAVFNALPVDSLDGGQALALILSRFCSPEKVLQILDIISLMILFPMLIPGFLLLLRSEYNFSLLLSSLYLIALILLKKRKT